MQDHAEVEQLHKQAAELLAVHRGRAVIRAMWGRAMACRRLAWWVPPVNGLMAPAVRWRRRASGSSFRALEAAAARRTGVRDSADSGFVAELRVLHDAFLAVPDLSFLGLAGVRAELLRHLRNRLRTREYLRGHPQVVALPVPQPVVVVGLPRTGTTLLHTLLASAPGYRAPLLWELLAPCPPTAGRPGPDPRRRDAERLVRLAHTAAPMMRIVHPLDACAPEECVFALPHSMAYHVRARIPGYRDWFIHRDATADYAYLRQQLQILQGRPPSRRWILKSPFHLWHLDALLRVFPDATIVWTHRDPCVALASWCSLVEIVMGLHNRRVDLHQLGRDWVQLWAQAVQRATRVRADAPERFVDIAYSQLAADPLATLDGIAARLGTELTPATRRQIAARVHRAGAARPGGHRYHLDRYGLTPQRVRDAFPLPP